VNKWWVIFWESDRGIYIWNVSFRDCVRKHSFGEWLGQPCNAKALLFMWKASHDEPHGVWTVIDQREYEFAHWEEVGWGGSIYWTSPRRVEAGAVASHTWPFFIALDFIMILGK